MQFDDNVKIKVKTSLRSQLDEIENLHLTSSLILSVCLIDTLAGFHAGYRGEIKGNKMRFNNFITEYLPEYKDDLYELRCNLVHSFSNVTAKYLFHDDDELSAKWGDIQGFMGYKMFDIQKFKLRLRKSFEQYFMDLEKPENISLREGFMIRYHHLGIIEDGVFPATRNLKGEIVRSMDEADTLPGTNIKFVIAAPIQVKK